MCTCQGCLVERMTGKAYAMEDFQEVIAGIITAGLKMNKRTHALQLMVYLLEHDVDVSHLYDRLRKGQADGHESKHDACS